MSLPFKTAQASQAAGMKERNVMIHDWWFIRWVKGIMTHESYLIQITPLNMKNYSLPFLFSDLIDNVLCCTKGISILLCMRLCWLKQSLCCGAWWSRLRYKDTEKKKKQKTKICRIHKAKTKKSRWCAHWILNSPGAELKYQLMETMLDETCKIWRNADLYFLHFHQICVRTKKHLH